mmetsp:Transcript_8916/g.17958  ORF Transcript_8916/g.17958 Transcript_8916/m.17958 type:complete len:117 (+) Transcript_8916:2108-2458(+)
MQSGVVFAPFSNLLPVDSHIVQPLLLRPLGLPTADEPSVPIPLHTGQLLWGAGDNEANAQHPETITHVRLHTLISQLATPFIPFAPKDLHSRLEQWSHVVRNTQDEASSAAGQGVL